MLLQLNPPIPVNTPKGPGECWILIDYSKEDHLLWVVALDDSGEVWAYKNSDIRAIENISLGRKIKHGHSAKRAHRRANNRNLKSPRMRRFDRI